MGKTIEVWDTEPDELKLVDDKTGYQMYIKRVPNSGHLCGYIGIPQNHPLWGKNYSDRLVIPNELMNPITDLDKVDILGLFAEALRDNDGTSSVSMIFNIHGGITYTKAHKPQQKPDGLWWLGFDCAHSGDLCPKLERFGLGGTYRDIEYVKRQCIKLAAQLKELEVRQLPSPN